MIIPRSLFSRIDGVCVFCVTGSSAKNHGGKELCSLLNRAIREDHPSTIIHAAVFAYAINLLLVQDRDKPQPWLRRFFPKSYPCVNMGRSCVLKGDGMFLDNRVFVETSLIGLTTLLRSFV